MTLSLYDVLDVEPTASPEEIRAAWKSAIADLDPGDRRFRAYNQAAEVLLDPERRSDYDSELAGTAESVEPEAVEPEAPIEPEPVVPAEPEPKPDPEPVAAPESVAEPGPEPEPEPVPEDQPPAIATWLLAAVGVVAAAVLATTLVLWFTVDRDAEPSSAETEKNAGEALAAAEQAAAPVLSYDYRTFDEGLVDAQSYMTTDYRAEHSELMSDLRSDILKQKLIVEAQLQGSGIVRVTGDRADILVLINQVTQKADTKDFVLPVWATLQMVEEDGTWRVDSITNEGAIGPG